MNFGFNQRNTRCTAVVMLFVWMMSLMVGFANACVVDEAHFAVRLLNADARDSAAGKHDDTAAKGACKAFCAAEETGVLKYHGNTLSTASATPLIVQAWVNPTHAALEPQRFSLSAPHWVPPPVHIRFLRLTI